MPGRQSLPQRPLREKQSSGHQNDCRTEHLHLRSDDPALRHFFTEHANYFQHEIKKMLDVEIQSLRSEFSLLLSAQMQKLQESNEKWMKLAENLVLQIHAMTEKLKTSSTLNQDWSGVNQATLDGMQAHDDTLNQLHDTSLYLKLAMSKAVASSPSQESRSWGDQLQPKEIAPSGSPVKWRQHSTRSKMSKMPFSK
jgi:hypothetical protein